MGIYDDYQYFHNNLFPQQFGQHVTLLPMYMYFNTYCFGAYMDAW